MLPLLLLALAADPSATFQEVKHAQVLFAVKVPSAGYWEFCLEGSKPGGEDPKLHTFAFAPVVVLKDGRKRIDSGGVAFPMETTFKVCARQRPGDSYETRLEAGQTVELLSAGQTKGPVKLTLTVREVKTGG